ncbi:MAG: hypothetical protein ACRENB_14030, partial [Gemmatimonadales bacterium]
ALARARAEGDVRLVGGRPGDSVPAGGRSLLAPALEAAHARGGRVVVVTDGEIEDAGELSRSLLDATTVHVFPRGRRPDLAITRVEGPSRLAAGDSLRLSVEITSYGGAGGRPLRISVKSGTRVWSRGTVAVPDSGSIRLELSAALPPVEPGAHVMTVAIDSAGDGEPRDDARLHLLSVAPTPGIVLLASPPTWESRFLLPVLRDVSGLPVRGYGRTEPGRWRRLGSLTAAPAGELAEAVRRADLLVTLGDPGDLTRAARVRSLWRFRAVMEGSAEPGDWYLATTSVGPLAGALAGQPLDSFAPATAIGRLSPAPGDWTLLTARAGRRGAERPAITGGDSLGVRRLDVGVDGLWRWAFVGGSAEQAYRAFVAGAVAWLLEGGDPATPGLRVRRPVVERGRPVVFERAGGDGLGPAEIRLEGQGTPRTDTLRFDGAGRAELTLEPGVWRFQAGGGGGVVAVEEFSQEWLPRPVTLQAREAAVRATGARRGLREQLWLFGIAVLGFAVEWVSRRRRGMR